jgi:hypothetical protein
MTTRPESRHIQYRMLTMHDPEFLTVPEADDENISTRDALKAPDAEQFKEAICKEVTDLIDTTKTLRALTPEFSPIVKPLTFAFMMQIAIAKGLIWCTADIKAAYLNVPRPAGEIPILTKLEPFVAEICGLAPNQLSRIDKCLYGLPDSGRYFYRHYRDALIKEEFIMSSVCSTRSQRRRSPSLFCSSTIHSSSASARLTSTSS